MNKRQMHVKFVIVEFYFEKQMTIFMKIVKIQEEGACYWEEKI